MLPTEKPDFAVCSQYHVVDTDVSMGEDKSETNFGKVLGSALFH